MAATAPTTTTTTPTPEQDKINSIQRVTDYPLIKSTLTTLHSYLSSSTLYPTLESYSTKSLSLILPHLPVAAADSYANAGLDYVEKKFPMVKTETGEDLVKRVWAPVDQTKGIAKSYVEGVQARLSPVTELVNHRLTQSQETLHLLQEKLSATVASLPRDKTSAQEYLNSIKGEIESLTVYLSNHVKELPTQAQSAAKPYLEALSNGAAHIKEEIAKPDTTLTTKASNILNYTTEQVTPLIQSVKELLVRKKEETVAAAEETAPKVNGTA